MTVEYAKQLIYDPDVFLYDEHLTLAASAFAGCYNTGYADACDIALNMMGLGGANLADVVIQEITGLADLQRCVGGSGSACGWLIAGLVPVGKIAKAINVGDAVRHSDDAAGFMDDAPLPGDPRYLPPDDIGRATGVEATLTKDSIGGATDPHVKLPEYGGRRLNHNKAHLLAAMLGGSNTDPRNFVIMFAYANSPVMRTFEYAIRDAVKAGQTVYYRVTPVYRGSDVIPIGVTMEARGVDGFYLSVSVINKP
jgi:hypothetical protein